MRLDTLERTEGRDAEDKLSAFFRPRSIALLGVSDDPTKMSGNAMRVIAQSGFSGKVYPVNPSRDSIGGVKAYSSVLDIPGDVDLALVTLPRHTVLEAIDQCGRKGVKAAIIITAGFAESGEEGAELQTELKAIAQRHAIRIIGPNCTGLFTSEVALPLGTSAAFASGRYQSGHIGLITQSGALGTALLPRAKERGLGASFWFSTGNEMDVNLPELLEAGAARPDTRAIGLYVEAIRNEPQMTRGLVAALEAGIPVVALKVGTSRIGAERAQAHTGALIGSDDAYEGYFRQNGVLRATSIDHLLPVCAAFDTSRPFGQGRVAVYSISGALAGHSADRFEAADVELARLSSDTIARLRVLGDNESANNPFDPGAGPQKNPQLAVDAMEAILADPGVDVLVVIMSFAIHMFRVIPPAVEEVARRNGKMIAVVRWVPADHQPQAFAAMPTLGVPIFESVEECAIALSARSRYETQRPSLLVAAEERATPFSAVEAPELKGGRTLLETEGRALLQRYGIGAPMEEVVHRADEAALAANRIGFPVVLKILSREVLHKTEAGGVALDLRDADQVRAAYDRILRNFRRHAPTASHEGVVVQAMAPGGTEAIIGAKHEAPFGPVVMVGLGGVLAEALARVAVRPAPLARFDAEQMIDECGLGALLASRRTGRGGDREAVVKALLGVSRLMIDHGAEIGELDVNPLRVLQEGEGAIALDALVVPPSLERRDVH
jgi:acyl-CoA synthetase (NDP forming)